MNIKIKLPGGEIRIEREKKERDWFPLWLGLGMSGMIGSMLWMIYILL